MINYNYGLYLAITYQLPITIYYNDGWFMAMAMDYYMDYTYQLPITNIIIGPMQTPD